MRKCAYDAAIRLRNGDEATLRFKCGKAPAMRCRFAFDAAIRLQSRCLAFSMRRHCVLDVTLRLG